MLTVVVGERDGMESPGWPAAVTVVFIIIIGSLAHLSQEVYLLVAVQVSGDKGLLSVFYQDELNRITLSPILTNPTPYFDLELARTHIQNEVGYGLAWKLSFSLQTLWRVEEDKMDKCHCRLGRAGIDFYKSDSILAATVNCCNKWVENSFYKHGCRSI